MGLTTRITNALGLSRQYTNPAISFPDYLNLVQFSFNNNSYLVGALNQTIKGHSEEIGTGFDSLVQQAYRTNAVVFACELARIQLFSEARFQFQRMRNGRPGELYGLPSLDILEHPWKTAITGDLLTRALLDADFGGTAFHVRTRSGIRRLRPDWVTMILGSENDVNMMAGDPDAEVIGLAYQPGGKADVEKRPVVYYTRDQFSVFAPIPDPLATYRGMPWVMPVIREVVADKQMTDHKSQFLVNGATPNLTVAVDKDLKEAANPKAFAEWVEAFKKSSGSEDAWRKYSTWYLAGGTTVTKVGSNMQEIDFKAVQGAGETRIAAAAGVPPVIVGLSEGLQAATYSNYGQARRRFADNTMRPLWRNIAGSLEVIVPPPSGSRLWYDDRDIQALAEDKKDLAEVRQLETQQMRTLIDTGFTADSVVKSVTTGDWSQLAHTGLFSVQLQAPGSTKMPAGEVPGETPVGPGTKPATLPAGDTSTKPLTSGVQPSQPSGRELELAGALRALEAFASRNDPGHTITVHSPDIHIPAPDLSGIDRLAEGVRDLIAREQPIPQVTVEAADLSGIESAIRDQPAPVVNVEAPVVNVAAPEVTVTVEPLSEATVRALTVREVPVVNVQTPATLDVNILSEPPSRKRTRVTKRNGQGQVDETLTEDA